MCERYDQGLIKEYDWQDEQMMSWGVRPGVKSITVLAILAHKKYLIFYSAVWKSSKYQITNRRIGYGIKKRVSYNISCFGKIWRDQVNISRCRHVLILLKIIPQGCVTLEYWRHVCRACCPMDSFVSSFWYCIIGKKSNGSWWLASRACIFGFCKIHWQIYVFVNGILVWYFS